MVKLKRLKFDYHPVEDRIRLQGLDETGRVVHLWLTARLLNRLIPHLAAWLTGTLPARAPRISPLGVPAGAAPQQATPRAPAPLQVRPSTAEPEAPGNPDLVEGVAVQSSADGVCLRWRSVRGEDLAEMRLSRAETRQWLLRLYQVFRGADWPVAGWPAWIAEQVSASTAGRPDGRVVIH